MSLRKHEPVDESEMGHVSRNDTICQMLREIYWEADKIKNEDIKLKARIATAMAKRMSNKLEEYKKHWDADFWDRNIFHDILTDRYV